MAYISVRIDPCKVLGCLLKYLQYKSAPGYPKVPRVLKSIQSVPLALQQLMNTYPRVPRYLRYSVLDTTLLHKDVGTVENDFGTRMGTVHIE